MFCILHRECPRSGDNGHCTVFFGTRRVNRTGRCEYAHLPSAEAMGTAAKKVNPLKASRRKARNK
jgi:hypothetical protein